MKASSIPSHEQGFLQNGIDIDGKVFKLQKQVVTIPGTNQTLELYNCPLANGDQSFFYPEQLEKRQIVLHYTAGFLKSDVATLTKPHYHVSVPFIVARNGAVLNMWNSRAWCYHLGAEAVGGNKVLSQHSVAIELSNIGYLKRLGNNLVTVYSDADVYCTLADTALYTKLDTPYRGQQYFATFTTAQYTSLKKLLLFLTSKYQIPYEFVPEGQRYNTLTAVFLQQFRGILSHVNYRPTGKWDIGPAFDWGKLV